MEDTWYSVGNFHAPSPFTREELEKGTGLTPEEERKERVRKKLARCAHLVRRNVTSTTWRRMVLLDTETSAKMGRGDTREHHFRLGVAAWWLRDKEGQTVEYQTIRLGQTSDFWDFVLGHTGPDFTLRVLGHNIAYDLIILGAPLALVERGWQADIPLVNERVFAWRWWRGEEKIEFVDTANIFHGSLAEWGEAVGLPKESRGWETGDAERLYQYCERDVEIVHRMMGFLFDLQSSESWGDMKTTLSGLAMGLYKHKSLKGKIKIHTDEKALEVERAAYRGGRFEALRVGRFEGENFYELDINAAYPWAMGHYEYPYRYLALYEDPRPKTVETALKMGAVIAKVQLEVDEPLYPLKPDRHNLYPVGRFNTYLTTREMKIAWEKGWVKKVYEMAYYVKAPLFQELMGYLKGLRERFRKAGELAKEKFIKGLANAFYGKWGQKGHDDRLIGHTRPDIVGYEPWYFEDEGAFGGRVIIGGNIYLLKRVGEARESFPAIAAHVTADVRLLLYQYMQEAGRENVYHLASDSMVVNEAGYRRLSPHIDDHEWGKLKVKRVGTVLEVKATSDWTLDGVEHIKGKPAEAEWIDVNSFVKENWPSFLSYLATCGHGPYYTYGERVKLSRKVKTGIADSQGYVEPFVLKGEKSPSVEIAEQLRDGKGARERDAQETKDWYEGLIYKWAKRIGGVEIIDDLYRQEFELWAGGQEKRLRPYIKRRDPRSIIPLFNQKIDDLLAERGAMRERAKALAQSEAQTVWARAP